MSLLVVGSCAIDTVETPHGLAKDIQGGSATYCSYAATFFSPVRLVGVVGTDFPETFMETYRSRPIDLAGLVRANGKTFRWHGRYEGDMGSATTVSVELNLLAEHRPRVPEAFRTSRYLFLANAGPEVQGGVLDQVEKPKFVLCDTMNLWIETERRALLDLVRRVDGLILNDMELFLLTGNHNTIRAAQQALDLGPKLLVVKKGEHGAMLFTRDEFFAIPAFPVAHVVDPTGAGDTFAGGFMGYIAEADRTDFSAMKRALLYGNTMASFVVEGFGIEGIRRVTRDQVDRRYEAFLRMITV